MTFYRSAVIALLAGVSLHRRATLQPINAGLAQISAQLNALQSGNVRQ